MKIPRIPDTYTRPLWLWAMGGAAFANLTAVFLANGNWVNFLFSAAVGTLAVLGYQQRTRHAEAIRLAEHRRQRKFADRAFWAGVLNESDSAAQRKLAVEMLDYLGNPVSVDPLADPKREQPEPAVDSGQVKELAGYLAGSRNGLADVIRIREGHLRNPGTRSPVWIAACDLLLDTLAEAQGHEQEFEDIAVRSWGDRMHTYYRTPVGPSPREQLLKRAESITYASRNRAPSRPAGFQLKLK